MMVRDSIEAIVLAGGFGTRLREEVPDLPKPMAIVAGRPFLEHLLERLQLHGVNRVVLSVGYLAEKIISHFGNEYCGMEIVYAHEQEPLGTGGAIALALSLVRSDRALVLNGDTYLDMDYKAFLADCDNSFSGLGIVVRNVPDASRYGRCDINDNVLVSFSEKGKHGPGLINAGVYCVPRNLFLPFSLPAKFSFEQDFVGKFLDRLKPRGFPVNGYFIDIGVPVDYRKAQSDFAASGGTAFSGAGA